MLSKNKLRAPQRRNSSSAQTQKMLAKASHVDLIYDPLANRIPFFRALH